MRTAKEIYQESLEKIQSVEIITEVSTKIREITTALYAGELKDWSGDQISRAISSLAVLRVNLGREVADAMAYADISYLYRKMRYAGEWKPTKESINKKINRATVQDIEAEVLSKIAAEQEEELQSKHRAEQLRLLYDSTETLITALQSRLSILKQEMYESRGQT